MQTLASKNGLRQIGNRYSRVCTEHSRADISSYPKRSLGHLSNKSFKSAELFEMLTNTFI